MRVTAERSVYSDRSSRTSLSGEPNSASASARPSSVLPTPVGPRNRNDPTGRPGCAEPGPAAAHGVGDGLDGLVLPDDAPVQQLLEAQQPVALGRAQLGDRDAGAPRHDLRRCRRR